MNNNSSDADCENNIKENVDTYIEKKHIEIDGNIKLMESCEEIKKNMETLDISVNMDYVDIYNNILYNHKNILNTESLIDILNKNTDKSIQEDEQIQSYLDNIDEIRRQINKKFIYKFNLCSEYIQYYNQTKSELSKLYNMYNINIIEIVEKNKKYNEMIDFLLEEYNVRFNEYKQKIKIEYPKNYIVHLTVSMIILQDNRSKTNIKFKDFLIKELEIQKTEILNQIKISDKIKLNSSIIGECYNMKELIDNLNNKLDEEDNGYI